MIQIICRINISNIFQYDIFPQPFLSVFPQPLINLLSLSSQSLINAAALWALCLLSLPPFVQLQRLFSFAFPQFSPLQRLS